MRRQGHRTLCVVLSPPAPISAILHCRQPRGHRAANSLLLLLLPLCRDLSHGGQEGRACIPLELAEGWACVACPTSPLNHLTLLLTAPSVRSVPAACHVSSRVA